MDVVDEALKLKATPSPKNESKTHLQHLLGIHRKDGPTHTIPDKEYIASDCLDHFFAGMCTTNRSTNVHVLRFTI